VNTDRGSTGGMDVPRIRFKRWRNKKLGYIVNVLDTRNDGCPTVTVDRTQFAAVKRTWHTEKFLIDFEPVGRPFVTRSLWELL
jgi:hypothetical protein